MWNLCSSGSGACSREQQPVLACQPEMWIIYTAIKCSKIVSAWVVMLLEQHVAILLLPGGMYTQGLACGPALSCLVPWTRRQQYGFQQQLMQLPRCCQRLVSDRGLAQTASCAACLEPHCLPPSVNFIFGLTGMTLLSAHISSWSH